MISFLIAVLCSVQAPQSDAESDELVSLSSFPIGEGQMSIFEFTDSMVVKYKTKETELAYDSRTHTALFIAVDESSFLVAFIKNTDLVEDTQLRKMNFYMLSAKRLQEIAKKFEGKQLVIEMESKPQNAVFYLQFSDLKSSIIFTGGHAHEKNCVSTAYHHRDDRRR